MEGSRSKNDSTMFWEASGGGGGGAPTTAASGVTGGNRRRKKRPSYGVRTVEITKGKNGFGFTISGQAPCMLSYIVPGSSAERSGLRLGDYLIAVNGQNVSKAAHDDVVRIIGLSKLLKLQIAENYYSDSSDDEFVAVSRQKPKFPNRLRHKQQQTRAERVVRDLQSGAIFSERAAIQLGEAALLSDRDWPDSFPSKLPNAYSPPSAALHNTAGQLPEAQSTASQQCSSPTRRRFMPLVFGDSRHPSSITPTRHFEDVDQMSRARQSPVKTEKMVKLKAQVINVHQQQQAQQPQQQQQQQEQQQEPNQQQQPQQQQKNQQQRQHQLQHEQQQQQQQAEQPQHPPQQPQLQQQQQQQQQEQQQEQQLQQQEQQQQQQPPQQQQTQQEQLQQQQQKQQEQQQQEQQQQQQVQQKQQEQQQQQQHQLQQQQQQQQQQKQQEQQQQKQQEQQQQQKQQEQLQQQKQQEQQQQQSPQKTQKNNNASSPEEQQQQQQPPHQQQQQKQQQSEQEEEQQEQQQEQQQQQQQQTHQQSQHQNQQQHQQQQHKPQQKQQHHQQPQQQQQKQQQQLKQQALSQLRAHPPRASHNHNLRLGSHPHRLACHVHRPSLQTPFSPKLYHRQAVHLPQQLQPPHAHHPPQLDNDQYQQQKKTQHLVQQLQPHLQHADVAPPQQIYDKQYHQLMLRHHQQNQQNHSGGVPDDVRIITEQEINKILYPTLAELQLQGPPPDLGESLYRAVVGYLGTIEVPKDPQGGSRLTAIKNCIRRLRIEKKVHTLVLMSVFNERVVLTNPHGITLAQYPAERITFCGVYADDKKFFGLVTVHGSSSDEFSDVSNDGKGNGRSDQGVSSSCHVFMVDPSMVEHNDHARRAKTFRIECTPAEDNAPITHCKEFPDTADPILHTIMSLYRSQPGFNFDNGGNNAALAEDAQMSPQHSNTSSNSSNSDSGIGFRDDGGSHLYRHMDRVFVVEVDDNQRLRIQNYHLVNNSRNNSNSSGANSNNASTNANSRNNSHLDNIHANVDNIRSNINFNLPVINGSLGSNILLGEASDSGLRTGNSYTNPRTNSTERNASCSNKGNYRAINTRDRLRKCDPKCAKSSLDNDAVPSDDLRVSVTENSCDRDSMEVNCAMDEDKDTDLSASHSSGNNNHNSNLSDFMKIGASDSSRRKRSKSRVRPSPSEVTHADGRSSITDELLVSALAVVKADRSPPCLDGRSSVTDEKIRGGRTPAIECSSPSDIERLTVRAMPDPVGIERAPVPVCEADPHVNSMRHSMHKYLQHKQQHLVKVSQKINRRESDTDGIHPLSVRAFSPAHVKKKAITPTPTSAVTQNSLDLELSLKLSPKVYGLPVACLTSTSRPNAPSERSFSRSLEDLRDSSTSDGVNGSVGAQRDSFRDGSESDQCLEKIRHCPLPSRLPINRYFHASETNLTNYDHPHSHAPHRYPHEAPRGAFRAVPPRAPPRPPSDFGVSRFTGTRPCGIASIDQIINGVARLGTARSCASPALLNVSNVMGPPLTTTILKSVASEAHKNSQIKSLEIEREHYPECQPNRRESPYDRSFNTRPTYDIVNTSLNAIPNGTTAFCNLPNKKDGSVMAKVTTNRFGENCKSHQQEEAPAHEEYVLESDLDDQGAETGSSSSSTADAGRRAGRKHSLTRPLHRRPDRAAPSDNEHAGGGDSRGGSSEGAPSEAGDRVQAWATSFEKLLEDPVGLHTFTEFLRKEYSHENIYFWTACERYRLGISSDPSGNNNNNADSNKSWSEWSGKHAAAKTIYNTHLGDNAPEPVNVDAQARQMAQEGLRQPTQDLFAAAQKQVFSLMKFDSYSRFLKSALYEECLEREARGEDIQYGSQESLDPNLVILPSQLHHTSASDAQNANNFSKGKTELEERRRRSLLPWHRSKDRSKSKDRLLSGSSDARNAAASKNKRSLATAVGSKDNSSTKAKSLSASASRLVRGPSSDATPSGAGVRSNSVSRVVSSRHTSESSGSIGKTSDVSGSRTSLNSGCEGALLAGRKAVSKESLTSSDCVSLSGGEGSGGAATGRCRVVLPDRSQSVVAVRAGVSVDRVMRRLMDRRGLTFLAYNVVMAGKGDRLVSGSDDSSVLCGTEVRLQQLVLFRLDLPNQKTVCVKAKPHKMASDVLRPILAKYGFKLDLMHIHTAEDNPRPVNVKGQITELDGQKFIVQTKEDVKEWGLSGVGNGVGAPGSSHDSDALDAITNRVFEDLLQSKTSHQLLTNCDYDARSAKTEACSDYSGGVCGSLGRHSALPDKDRVGDAPAVGRNTSTGNRSLSSPSKDNDELYEGLKRAQMSRIEDQRGTKINSELPDFLKCDSENKENEMNVDEPDEPHFLPPDSGPTATALYFNSARTADPQYHPFYSQHHHHHHHHHFHFTPASQHQPPHPQLCPPEETSPSDEQSQFLPSSTTPLQQSSSSLTQHQAHHNFWSDISGGGSSIPSSLLATSSSSLSSSTGLPMSSSTNFEGIDTPLTIASNFLLDMHYDGPEISSRTKLRPRPESCVNTRPDAIMRADQANRPKSSCGSLTASPDRTLLAPPDLDKTLSSNTSMDHTGDIFSDVAMRGIEAEETGQPTRLQASVRPPLQQHRGTQYLRRRDHHHPSPLDCVMSQLASTGSNGLVSSASHLSDFSPLINSVDAGAVNINASGMSARPSANGSFNGNMSTPPPPLPPKPKLGAPARGPPPRPPSRQLPLGPTSTSGYVAGLLDGTALKLRGPGPCDMSSNQKLHNKDTVSFV